MTVFDPACLVEIPPLWCPVVERLHFDAEGVDDRLQDWVKGWDLIRGAEAAEEFRAAGFGGFSAWCYPGAVELDLMAQWMAWAWIIDDHFDEGYQRHGHDRWSATMRELLDQLPITGSPPRASGPLAAAAGDLWRRTVGPMSARWRHRYKAHLLDWMLDELTWRRRRHTDATSPQDLVLRTFQRRRRLSSGVAPALDLLEPGGHYELPELVASCTAYQQVITAANDSISYHNDLYSFRRESARGNLDHLVAVLKQQEDTDWPTALDQSARMADDALRDFFLAAQELGSMRSLFEVSNAEWDTVHDTLTSIGEWIAGSLRWHKDTLRYQRIDSITPVTQIPRHVEAHLVSSDVPSNES